MASASSTVRFPDRRSSPDGLPVTAGSPNTPEHVVAQLERHPEVGADVVEDGLDVGAVGGGGGAQLQGAGHGVGRGLVGVDASSPMRWTPRRWTRRRCRGTARRAPRCGCPPTPAAPGGARRPAGRRSTTMSSAQTSDRSPSRMAAEMPNCVGRAAPAAAAVQRRRSGCAPSACRGGWRSRRSRRRAPARTRAAVRGAANSRSTSRTASGSADRRPPRASPSRRTRGAAACRRAVRIPPGRRSGRRSRHRCRRRRGGGRAR